MGVFYLPVSVMQVKPDQKRSYTEELQRHPFILLFFVNISILVGLLWFVLPGSVILRQICLLPYIFS